ncbi:fasciclin domain-containing protein [Pontibacter sp. JH31]|uniref:Fasciclin domain-containing protein n=1 Tax=Pontibacter aquaedesilientis TaxID=2766980 RepID=A0ABR7XJP5_9BACT|nr:fasciclin domain-containing protein [Pontibacter aquaedesilientis]MBD1398487.1 fasciclin domain-containing protein [Pontibacter aquaedesilientis]
MRGLPIAIPIIVLFGFTVSSCDQRQGADNQTDPNGTELRQDGVATTPDRVLDEPATTTQAAPEEDDTSLEASRNIVDNAAKDKELTTFVSLLHTAKMVSNLNGTGPYTVFAPSEAGFKALPGSTLEDLMKPENRERLQQILNNHIISGKLAVDDLQDGTILKTVAGEQLKVSKRGGQVMINGALIEDADAMSKNGVLHTINKLLLPAEK